MIYELLNILYTTHSNTDPYSIGNLTYNQEDINTIITAISFLIGIYFIVIPIILLIIGIKMIIKYFKMVNDINEIKELMKQQAYENEYLRRTLIEQNKNIK